MLKLSGWSRLTWGRVGVHCIAAQLGSCKATTTRASGHRLLIVHHETPRSAPWSNDFQPSACRSTRETSIRPPTPPPTSWRRWGGRRCVTPRQTCPQPDGVGRNLRSKTRWFTGFCNSHQVSHFATFFIDARAEISVAESRLVYTRRSPCARPSGTPSPSPTGTHAVCPFSLALLTPEFGCPDGTRTEGAEPHRSEAPRPVTPSPRTAGGDRRSPSSPTSRCTCPTVALSSRFRQ